MTHNNGYHIISSLPPTKEWKQREELKRLGPTIIVAIDARGASVAKRLASLLRTNTRVTTPEGDQALRERFAFLQVQRDPDSGSLSTEVQAIKVEPSSQLWDLSVIDSLDRPFEVGMPRSFNNALDEAVKQVLSYTKVREELRQSGIAVRPSHLNVFFVGSIIEQEELPTIDDQGQDVYDALVATMKQQIETKLDELRRLANQTRNYAADSASLETVVRGAFLTLILPDSRFAAKQALQGNGTVLGDLLQVDQVGRPTFTQSRLQQGFAEFSEPPLHFCSLYTSHDEDGAWYEAEQLANAVAGAIYGLTMSELLDHSLCRTQLGLQDMSVSPYDRLLTVAATRSSFPKADLLDYAALSYGATLIEQLIPAPTMEEGATEGIRSSTARLLKFGELRTLLERPLGNSWDRQGRPRRLTRAALAAQPPDLLEHIKEPRRRLFQGWDEFARMALAELERYDDLSIYLEEIDVNGNRRQFVDEDNRPIQLTAPDGGTFIYNDEELFAEWHGWRKRLDTTIGDEPAEIIWRIDVLRAEVEQTFWGNVPQGVKVSGTTYVELLLDEVERQTIELRHLVERASLASAPVANSLEDELAQAQERSRQRVELGPIVALSSAVASVASYLFIGARDAGVELGGLLQQPDLTVALLEYDVQLGLPGAVQLGVICGLVVLAAGMIFRQFQLFRALQSIKAYAALVRRKFALRMYADELWRLEGVPDQMEQFVDYLRREADVHHEVARRFQERLRERATKVAERGFRDVTEYIPMTGGGPMEIYRQRLAPNLAQYLRSDLAHLRREAQALGNLTEGVLSAEHRPMMVERAERHLHRLVLGDRNVAESHAGAGLRHIAYRSAQRDLDIIAAENLTHALIERATELRGRTPLLVNLGFRPGQETFHQAYTIAPLAGSSQQPDLQDTIEVRSIDPQMIMYVRVVSRIWPRIFDSAELRLHP